MSGQEQPVSVWNPPPLDDCDQHTMPVGLDEIYRMDVRRVLWNGQLVGYAIVLSRDIAGRWVEMVSIDTFNHGCVHRHDGDHELPYKAIRPILSQDDVQQSFYEAYDEVYNEYLKAIGAEPLR